MQRDYLEPDKGNASNLLMAGAMATLFFTPVGGNIVKGIGRTLKRYGKGIGTAAQWAGEGIAAHKEQIMDVSSTISRAAGRGALSVAKAGGRGAGKGFEFLYKHKKLVTPVGVGIAAVYGAARGVTDKSTAIGPESYSTFEGGMPADNLGATGDLTLALHRNRR